MWALDLGTTNTLLARWDTASEQPVLCELPAIARKPSGGDELEAPRAVPSAVHVFAQPPLLARLGGLSRRFLLGKVALIGRPALDANQMRQRPAFAPSFKRELMRHPLRPLVRTDGRGVTAREVAGLFLRELFAEVKRERGERIRDLVITVPSDAFETYRAELSAITRQLGVRRLRFLDEPVAAAIGYGLSSTTERRVLVVDVGGGTMHMAVVALGAHEQQTGRATVLAKAARDLGGNLVDQWLLEEICARLGLSLDPTNEQDQLWRGLMLAEARRMKEALHLAHSAAFTLSLPDGARRLEAQLRGEHPLELEQADLARLLEQRGLYQGLSECLEDALREAKARGASEEQIDEVLMVGGSTLLPGVYALFEKRFGRSRVRAWQPFEAVAYGAAIFAAERVAPADFLVHDYALLLHDPKTQASQPTVVVPRGTRIPTPDDFWKRQLVPSCALGEPEKIFKLVICEISAGQSGRTFAWNSEGELHKLAAAPGSSNSAASGDLGSGASNGASPGAPLITRLNESNPALGHLDPPHAPSDPLPRLELSLGVNAERWLCATVLDLKTRKLLMRGEPVVRLA